MSFPSAEIAGRIRMLGSADRGLMDSLTLPQVATTLAAALVGFQTVNAASRQLINQAMLNTILVLVVVTSLLGPSLTQRFLRQLPAFSGHDGPVTGAADGSVLPHVEPASRTPA